jgi:hypothetical protein
MFAILGDSRFAAQVLSELQAVPTERFPFEPEVVLDALNAVLRGFNLLPMQMGTGLGNFETHEIFSLRLLWVHPAAMCPFLWNRSMGWGAGCQCEFCALRPDEIGYIPTSTAAEVDTNSWIDARDSDVPFNEDEEEESETPRPGERYIPTSTEAEVDTHSWNDARDSDVPFNEEEEEEESEEPSSSLSNIRFWWGWNPEEDAAATCSSLRTRVSAFQSAGPSSSRPEVVVLGKRKRVATRCRSCNE